MLDQVSGGDVLDLVDHPAALPADPAAAHVERLDRGLQLVLGERDDVAVGAIAQHDRLLLQGPVQRLDVIAKPRGPLVLLRRRGPAHLRLEPLGELAGLAGHEVAELLGQLAVLGGTDPADARRRALADVAQQAGRPIWPDRLNTPAEQVRTGKTRSSVSTVSLIAQACE